MTVVGFDFGTTNSLISVVVGGRAIDIVDPENGLPFPSVVRYEGEKKIVGRAAKEALDSAGVGIHGNTVLSPKFLLGDESVHVGGVERSPIDVVHDVVSFVKDEALKSPRSDDLSGVTKAVVTIPVGMTGPRRAALRDAFRRADIGIVHFVHEPLAALYGYFRSAPDTVSLLREYDRRNILVVDWGGGTLDLTLCRIEGRRILQIRNSGTDEVGGDRFDEAIRDHVIAEFSLEHGLGPEADMYPDARVRLRHDSEANKIALSTRSSATFYRQAFFRQPELTLEYRLTREAMEKAVAPLLAEGITRVQALLDSAFLGPPQIALCLVTGGMAQMPAVRGRLHELFGPHRVVVSDRASTLIAQGAAWLAHDERRLELARAVEVQLARGGYLPLLAAGTPMPIEREVKSATFHLYCADPRDGTAKFELCSPASLGAFPQKADPRLPLATAVVRVDPRAQPFRERLELEVTLNDDLILHARATSADLKDVDEVEVHDLEFSLTIDDTGTPAAAEEGVNDSAYFDDAGARSLSSHGEGGELDAAQPVPNASLVIRSNVADTVDDSLVPGELLYTYKPGYFDVRSGPPQLQVEERLYYQPCAVCGRASSDPACRCASGGGG